MKKTVSFLVFLFLSVCAFAQETNLFSGNLLKKSVSAQTKSASVEKNVLSEEKIDVIFYPKAGKSDNIDLSFFISRKIEYIKSEKFLSAYIPVSLINELKNINGVEKIDLNPRLKAFAVISEGYGKIKADLFTGKNVDGRGVKIAVIDVDFQGYQALQKRGELPQNITMVNFAGLYGYLTSSTHGSACAEIIYDIAPGAQLYLLKISDIVSLEKAFAYCKKNDIKIASCSIGFTYGFWPDGTGEFAQVAADAYNNGILPVFAAGNEADSSWFGKFNGDENGWMIFPNGKDYLELKKLSARGEVWMVWNDFADRNKEYILYLYDATGDTLIDSSSWQPGDKPSVYVTNTASVRDVRIKIKKNNDADDVEIRLCFDATYKNSSEQVSESSLSSPGDAREVLTVGALKISNWNSGPIDYYSSRGPTRETENLPQMQKPDISAPSYVSTISYGVGEFNGTSAATPHVAAAAALVFSLDRTINSEQLKNKVLSYYQQIDTSPDNNYGIGKLWLGDAEIAIQDDISDGIICYPNPASISKNGHLYITNFLYGDNKIDVNIYTVAGERVKSFNSLDTKLRNGKMTIEWNLKNDNGVQTAPGIYFVTIRSGSGKQIVKKIAIKK